MTDNVPVVNDGVKGPMASRDPSLAQPPPPRFLPGDIVVDFGEAAALADLVRAVESSPAARIAVPARILANAKALVAKLFPDEGAAE